MRFQQSPCSHGDLLALVAGRALPENIVNEIKSRGLAFHPGGEYLAQLETAGAESTILTTLNMAKISVSVEPSDDPHHVDFLKHLAQAGGLIRKKSYTEAVRELNAALAGNPDNASAGFVMGELLREQERWMPAASVYVEVLSRAPDFPEAHTKLAFIAYSMGDSDQAITEAKAALKRTPDNAEAHKNLGLVWGQGRHFEQQSRNIGRHCGSSRTMPLSITTWEFFTTMSTMLKPRSASTRNQLHWSREMRGITIILQMHSGKKVIRTARSANIARPKKRLDPDDLNVRNNLAGTLIDRDVDAAILEFRELVALAPRFELCRICFGHALYRKGDFSAAAEQYKRAVARSVGSGCAFRLGPGTREAAET